MRLEVLTPAEMGECDRRTIAAGPLDGYGLMLRAGGIRGLIHTALPVAVFAATSAVAGLTPATIAAIAMAALLLAWQLIRREPIRPALLGFAAVAPNANANPSNNTVAKAIPRRKGPLA